MPASRSASAKRAAHLTAALPLVVLPLMALLLAGCHAAAPRADRSPTPSGNERGADAAGPVAEVRGRRLSKGELADWWFDRYPEEYGRTLNALVDERLAIGEAREQGVRVPREA